MKKRSHDKLENLLDSLSYENWFSSLMNPNWKNCPEDVVSNKAIRAILTAQSILPNYLFKAMFHRLYLHETYDDMIKIGIKNPRWRVNRAIRLINEYKHPGRSSILDREN
jgi:hypothetical protein